VMLTVATALSPGLPWLLILCFEHRGRMGVALIAVAHLGVLGLNVAARQVVQNMNLKPYYDVYAQPTAVEWSPMALFLTAFVFMVAVVGWMIVKIARNPTP